MNRSGLLKLITWISLICYLAVASIASAHAFPMMSLNSQQNDQTMSQASCHQGKGLIKATSLSVCKIFCAAMANVIPTISSQVVLASFVSEEIVYFGSPLLNRDPELEPQPPK